MTEIKTWDWGFSYVCPECNHWNSYHRPEEQPKYLSYTIDIRSPSLRPQSLIARFDCPECGADLNLTVADFPQ